MSKLTSNRSTAFNVAGVAVIFIPFIWRVGNNRNGKTTPGFSSFDKLVGVGLCVCMHLLMSNKKARERGVARQPVGTKG